MILTLSILAAASFNHSLETAPPQIDITIDEYKAALFDFNFQSATLYCEDLPDTAQHQSYRTCSEFKALKTRKCYGYSTYDMAMEMRFENACAELALIEQTSAPNVNFFDLTSGNWWWTIPAELIPMSGGIYSDEGYELAKQIHKTRVEGKLLKDVLSDVQSTKRHDIDVNLAETTHDCGVVTDNFTMKLSLVADFNHDGAADLLIKGYRVNRSDSCHLGSGNGLGASYSVILQKPSADAPITVHPLELDQ